jgi:hypothetical protein
VKHSKHSRCGSQQAAAHEFIEGLSINEFLLTATTAASSLG